MGIVNPRIGKKIGNDPGRSGYREILCVAGPTEQFVGVGKKCRQPYQQREADKHQCEQPRGEKSSVSRKQSNGRERKGNRGCNRPEHLSRRNPLGNERSRRGKVKSCSSVNEITQIPKNRYPIREILAGRPESSRLVQA